MARSKVDLDSGKFMASFNKALGQIAVGTSEKARQFSEEAVKRTARTIPRGIEDPEHPHKHLDESYQVFTVTLSPGSIETTFGSDSDHADIYENGSKPHEIRIKNKLVLANRLTGEFFGKVVHHPGTEPHGNFRLGIAETIETFDWHL